MRVIDRFHTAGGGDRDDDPSDDPGRDTNIQSEHHGKDEGRCVDRHARRKAA